MTSTETSCLLDNSQAHRIVELAIAELKKEENQTAMQSILKECEQFHDNPLKQFSIKMQKIIPRVMEILGTQIDAVVGSKLTDQAQIMKYVGHIQSLAASDVHLGIQVNKIVRTLSGDFTGLYEEDDEEEAVQEIE